MEKAEEDKLKEIWEKNTISITTSTDALGIRLMGFDMFRIIMEEAEQISFMKGKIAGFEECSTTMLKFVE